jgi:Na+-driven multidrug efflux pump
MSHVASSTLGTIDLAGHQIILSIFGCITPFVDALSQVAQSLVPGIFASNGHGQQQQTKGRKKERAIALRQTVMNFRIVGLGAGAVLVGLISCVPFVSQYFTTNKAVLERVHGAIKPVSLFLIVNGLMCAGEGKKIDSREMWTISFC